MGSWQFSDVLQDTWSSGQSGNI